MGQAAHPVVASMGMSAVCVRVVVELWGPQYQDIPLHGHSQEILKGGLNLDVEYLRASHENYTCAQNVPLGIKIKMNSVCIYVVEAYTLLFMQLMETVILLYETSKVSLSE